MFDINGNIINEAREIGTIKYNLKINYRYFVRFEEIESKRGIGSYSNGALNLLNVLPNTDKIILSNKKEDAQIIDGKMNLKGLLNKLLNDWNYKFYNMEVIEIEKGEDDE